MTEYLFGNYLNWCQGFNGFDTINPGGGRRVQAFTPDTFENRFVVPQPNPTKEDMILMSGFGGKFVGMIANVSSNNMRTGAVSEFEFIKTQNFGATVINTGVKIVVPGGEVGQEPTGLFYSNTDIAEFTRTWEPLEFIGIKVSKPPGGDPNFDSRGIQGCTLMICFDLDLPPPVIIP